MPVIFLTAHSDRETLMRAKLSQLYGYLVKPLGNSDFSITIEIAINKHSLDKNMKLRLAQLADVFLSSPVTMIVTDTEGIIQFINAEAAQTIKCSEFDWRGRRFLELVPLFERVSGRPSDDFVNYASTNGTPSRDEIFRFPEDLYFLDPDGLKIIIEGEVALGLMPNQYDQVGAIITFRSVTRPRGSFVAR